MRDQRILEMKEEYKAARLTPFDEAGLPLVISMVAAFGFGKNDLKNNDNFKHNLISGFFIKEYLFNSIFSLFSFQNEKRKDMEYHEIDKSKDDLGNIDYTEDSTKYISNFVNKVSKGYKSNPLLQDKFQTLQSTDTFSTRRQDSNSEIMFHESKPYYNSMPIFLSKPSKVKTDFQPFFPIKTHNKPNGYHQHNSFNDKLEASSDWSIPAENTYFQQRNRIPEEQNILLSPQVRNSDTLYPHANEVNTNLGWEKGWKRMVELDTVIAGVDAVKLERGGFRGR